MSAASVTLKWPSIDHIVGTASAASTTRIARTIINSRRVKARRMSLLERGRARAEARVAAVARPGRSRVSSVREDGLRVGPRAKGTRLLFLDVRVAHDRPLLRVDEPDVRLQTLIVSVAGGLVV